MTTKNVATKVTILISTLFTLACTSLYAWSPTDGKPVCATTYNQVSTQIVSDKSGGAYITWQDYRNTTGNFTQSADIFVQRVNGSGTMQWTTNGISICTSLNTQSNPQLTVDTSGGIIITWQDSRSSSTSNFYDIYAQRVNSSGSTLWTTNGVAISTASNNQINPQIAADTSGGAIIVWQDSRTSTANNFYNIYAQRVNSTGSTLWTTNGVLICTSLNDQSNPQILPDGSGGAFLCWQDFRRFTSNGNIYVQRINSVGSTLWTFGGVSICFITSRNATETNPTMVADSSGGIIVTWQDKRGGREYDIYSQRVNSNGSTLWTSNGVVICNATKNQTLPQIATDSANGAIITWQDYRNNTNNDIYAQRVNSNGSTLWTTNGIQIAITVSSQTSPQIIPDGAGGAIITWTDYRSTTGNLAEGADIYAQRVSSTGSTFWTVNGVPIVTAIFTQEAPHIATDGSRGAIITWQDYRSTSGNIAQGADIYAQSINSSGNTVLSLPNAGFFAVPTAGVGPLTVYFIDTSDFNPTSWAWDFGDGGTATTQYPVYVYSNNTVPTYYTVRLIASNGFGSSTATHTSYIYVIPGVGPQAGFLATPTAGLGPLGVYFVDTSVNFPTTWSWDFGDGVGTDSTQFPIYTYAAVSSSTTYTVREIVSNAYGTSTQTRPDYIFIAASNPPVPGFFGSPTAGIGPLIVNFADTSGNFPDTWAWDFGDGIGTDESQFPSYIYGSVTTLTSYTVTLIVDNLYGETTAVYPDYIVIYPQVPPIAAFYGTPTSGVGPLSVNFVDTSADFPSAWNWDFGDGGTSTTQNPTHLYASVSTPTYYTVQLIASSPYGVSTISFTNYIFVTGNMPSIAFYGTPTVGTSPLLVNFVDTSLNFPTSWNWSFGDGGIATTQNPAHTYSVVTIPTNYTVTLIGINAYGSSTLTQVNYILVNPPAPSAGFSASPLSGYGPLPVSFTDTSGYLPTSWNWDFGDGSSTTDQNPIHIYGAVTTATDYTVTLIASNPYGSNTVIMTNLIHVAVAPVAPIFTFIPDIKLFSGTQSLSPAFKISDYNSGDIATSYSIVSNFLSLTSISGDTVSQSLYSTPTSGTNVFEADNFSGSAFPSNKVKYSTYKIYKLPPVVIRPGNSIPFDMSPYTYNIAGRTIPPSFGNSSSLIISDTTQISATWADISTVVISALGGFNTPQEVDVIAAPVAGGFGQNIDKEKILVYPSLSTTAFEFSNSNDLNVFSFQLPGGITALPTVSWVSSVNDASGAASHGGALQVTFSNPNSAVKITPTFSAWLPNTPGQYYTLRVRAFGTSASNFYLQLLYNGVPASTPTDVQGYFRYNAPGNWATIDIPVNSFSSVSSGAVMYPQLVLRGNGSTGIIYVDEMEIMANTPTLIGANRYITTDTFVGGYWNDPSATTKWSIQALSGNPSYSVDTNRGALIVNTSGASQSSLKFTAIPGPGSIYTFSANSARQAGMHMRTKLLSGANDLINSIVQVNVLGATGSGSFTQGGDLAAAAEIGRISDRTLRLAFPANNNFYQVQFLVKNAGTSSILIDNTQTDKDSDDEFYGEHMLFP